MNAARDSHYVPIWYQKRFLNPKSYGEIVADISSPYKYPPVAVVEEHNKPMLIIRTEEGVQGAIYIRSLSRNGDHRNFGKFPDADAASFLQRVVEEVLKLDTNKENPSRDGAAYRVIVNCPSFNSALRLPKGESGRVRCKVCAELFEACT